MIRKEGYPAEAHVVLTEDGYILTMHRIVGKPGSSTIFLQHGVLGCSMDWIILGKKNSLGTTCVLFSKTISILKLNLNLKLFQKFKIKSFCVFYIYLLFFLYL